MLKMQTINFIKLWLHWKLVAMRSDAGVDTLRRGNCVSFNLFSEKGLVDLYFITTSI